MDRRRLLLILPGLLFLGWPPAAAAPPPARPGWLYRKPVALPPLLASAFVEARLDAEVYREAAPGLGDLRIHDRGGAEVPYVLRRHETPRSWQERDVPLLDLEETARGDVRFVLDLGLAPGIHSRVRVRVGDEARNFRVPVQIETSADRDGWQLVRQAGFIYMVEGETRAADTTVSYPPSTARYVRVTVSPPPVGRFSVTGAAIIVEAPAVRSEEIVPATLAERREDPERQTTVLVLDLGGRRPADRAELEVAEPRFHRVVFVEAGDDKQSWRWLASGAISALETARFHERHTRVAFPEVTGRYLRLTIQNRDDRPLRIVGVRLAAVRRGVVFQAAPGQAYTLEYGDATRPAPRYDLSRAFPYLESETLPVATLGGAARVAVEPPPTPWSERRPILLWGAMGIVALALAGLLVRLARQIRPAAGGEAGH